MNVQPSLRRTVAVVAAAALLAGCAATPTREAPSPDDPFEPMNRVSYSVHEVVDGHFVKPMVQAYVDYTPQFIQLGIRNFFGNIDDFFSFVNAMLQGKPDKAGHSLGRVITNTGFGIFGIVDVASDAVPKSDEDFGQTLGTWGWERSRYVELPLFGPRTMRDVLGLVGDGQLSPIRQVEDDPTRVFLQGLQLVDVRTQLFAVDSMREGAADDYALVRDAWLQRRRYQIFGDRKLQDEELPEYLREDTGNPSVPADAMPIMPAGGN